MSLRYEQYSSLAKTLKLLRDELHKETRCKTITERKAKILNCLRHFPPLYENGQPIWSQDDFTQDEPKTGEEFKKQKSWSFVWVGKVRVSARIRHILWAIRNLWYALCGYGLTLLWDKENTK